ncbi:amino acid ABC transporter [Oceaniradius stylonematis]|uniref:Amino acid ABC transporter n=2 Tax=Oceaniradius stylonematis TaxID=2184161 RepID=A0A3A8ACD5_9HYPH|nr:amino acid ABC transporter [Oceaniradius stylonematis]RNC96895.1 MAG: amino acid ABC transporter [Oricola sp.]
MMKTLTGMGAAALVALGLSASGAAAEKILVATEASYPPFSQTEADGSYSGFEIDLGNEVCARIEAECEWVKQDFDGAIAALLADKFRMIFSAMSITDERKKVADFSLAYFNVKDAFVARKGEVTTFPDDLAGKTIGGYEASAGVRAFMAENYPDIEFRGYQRFDQIAADMQAGRIVGALEAETPIREFLGKPEGADFEIVHSGFCITCSGAGAMFRKGDDELRERVNTALREIYADGTFDTIAARWFPEGMNLRADMLWDQ